MLEKKYSRIEDIDAEISELKAKILELEAERSCLLKEVGDDEAKILGQLPVRAKNALTRLGITSDLKLKRFLHGDTSFVTVQSDIHESRYLSATTFLDRLISIRNIGMGTAQETIKFLEQYHDKFFEFF